MAKLENAACLMYIDEQDKVFEYNVETKKLLSMNMKLGARDQILDSSHIFRMKGDITSLYSKDKIELKHELFHVRTLPKKNKYQVVNSSNEYQAYFNTHRKKLTYIIAANSLIRNKNDKIYLYKISNGRLENTDIEFIYNQFLFTVGDKYVVYTNFGRNCNVYDIENNTTTSIDIGQEAEVLLYNNQELLIVYKSGIKRWNYVKNLIIAQYEVKYLGKNYFFVANNSVMGEFYLFYPGFNNLPYCYDSFYRQSDIINLGREEIALKKIIYMGGNKIYILLINEIGLIYDFKSRKSADFKIKDIHRIYLISENKCLVRQSSARRDFKHIDLNSGKTIDELSRVIPEVYLTSKEVKRTFEIIQKHILYVSSDINKIINSFI